MAEKSGELEAGVRGKSFACGAGEYGWNGRRGYGRGRGAATTDE